MNPIKKALVLLSGGLDSTTTLALAKNSGFDCYTLSFDYGQRHATELKAAEANARLFNSVSHKTLRLDLGSIGGSALTDPKIDVPEILTEGIPITYVPARNTVFLSIALAWAEVLSVNDIFIGVNAVDFSGYPDCRPDFIEAFERLANLATKAGRESGQIKIHAPLINLTKAEIIKKGISLGLDYSKTISCYQANDRGEACGKCDSCRLRSQGFIDAGIIDPTLYA